MKLFTVLITTLCVMGRSSWAGDEKQIKLEDIERDTLVGETERTDEPQLKELTQQPSQHIQLSYSDDPQDIFVTSMPGRYASKASSADLRPQHYHLPKVHEAEQTYTVPAKQTLIQPIIGGSSPIQPVLTPQPQYIYIQSPQSHQPYMPQAHAYVMVPYSSHYTPQHSIHVQPQSPTPTPTVYTYSHGLSSSHHQPAYQSMKSLEYNVPATSVTPLQTSVDYKNNAPITIVPKKTLPSMSTTSFQQYYSPGLEYHYTEAVPITKLSPHSTFSYQHVPSHSNYAQANYVSQAPSYSYYHAGPSSLSSNFNKHQSSGLLDSYVPSLMTFARQQQNQYKNYYPTPYLQNQHYPQHLFTPSQSSSSFAPFPSPQAYNTIQYSVSLPPYPEHSKRSTSKATATLNVKAPKTN